MTCFQSKSFYDSEAFNFIFVITFERKSFFFKFFRYIPASLNFVHEAWVLLAVVSNSVGPHGV